MTYSTAITISVPLTRADRQQARKFAQLQPNANKAVQVYRNTLAVLATRTYLQMLDIPTDLEASYSWNPIAFLSADVADLYLPELNRRLECRAVEPEANTCFFPPEVQTERVGYVVIRLDETKAEATVLGFVPKVIENLSLRDLQSLEALIDRLSEPIAEPVPVEVGSLVALRDWLDGIFGSWQPLEALPQSAIAFAGPNANDEQVFQRRIEELVISQPAHASSESTVLPASEPQAVLAHLIQTTQDEETRFKAAELLWEIAPDHPAVRMRRAKDLGLYLAGHSIALLVVLLPRPDDRVAILARVYATGRQLLLPAGLKLILLDENGGSFFEVTARQQDDYIQCKVTADFGDRFSIRVAIDADSITENFSI